MFGDDPLLADASPRACAVVVVIYLALLAAGTVTAVWLAFRLARPGAPWAERARHLTGRPLSWGDGGRIMLAVLSLVGLAMLLAIPLRRCSEESLMVLQTVLVDIGSLAAIAILLRRRGLTWRASFWQAPEGLPTGRAMARGFVAYLAMLPCVVFASLVAQGVLSTRGYPPSVQDVAEFLMADHSAAMRAYLLILAVAIAPIFEETVFRGVLLPLAARRFGQGAGIVLTSVLFSAIHFHLYSAVPLFVVAVNLSLAYVYCGSLWVPVVMHGLFNGINLGLLLILKYV